MYLLWSTTLSGFLTSSGTYTSQWKEAQEFNELDARTRCKARYDERQEAFILLPVSVEILR